MNSPSRLPYRRTRPFPGSWTPDGRFLILASGRTLDNRLARLPAGGATGPETLGSPPIRARRVTLSPDGRWLATQESEGGAWRLFLRPFPNVDDARIPVATDNLSLRPPVWSRNGQELFYATGDRLMSVTVGGGNPPALGKPALVLDLADSNGGFGYATPESRERVLVSRSIGRSAGAPVEYRVVLNWFTELNARMPQ